MIFRILGKEALAQLYGVLSADNPVEGPAVTGRDRDGLPLYTFSPITEYSELALDYSMTRIPPKHYYLPYHESLASFEISGRHWCKDCAPVQPGRATVLFGLHPCDINAICRLDKVLMHSDYPSPYYASRRRNLFIVGVDCTPGPECFCRSMGTDTVLHGFDMFLTDLGDRYFVEVRSDTAYNYLREVHTTEPTEADHLAYISHRKRKDSLFTAHVDNTDLTKILDMEFDSPVWEYWARRCFSCGSCAMACPTCYCYGVTENVSLDMQRAVKTRSLHSCNLIDFAVVAGGHNFRPTPHTRLKYRYYHKHRGFVEAYEEPLCVGCGRCAHVCLGGIRVPDVIASVRKGEPVG